MDIALSTVLIIILIIIPGLVYRKCYYTGEFSKEYFKSTPFEVLMASLIPGVFFQSIFLLLFHKWFGINGNLGTLGQLYKSEKSLDITNSINQLYNDLPSLLIYTLLLWVMVAIIGASAKFIIRKLKFDRKFRIFRFQNNWHYILRGEILDFDKPLFRDDWVTNDNENLYYQNADFINGTSLDVLVNTGNKQMLYTGLLDEIILTKEGDGLELIVLSNVSRQEPFEKNSLEKRVYGDKMVILSEHIININITYLGIWELDEEYQPSVDIRTN
jgi:hypothetical protein